MEILHNKALLMEESDQKRTAKEWKLEAETEYRFELDPGTTLAIKVRLQR